MQSPVFAVVGPGRLGLSLAVSLTSAGWKCARVRARDTDSARIIRARHPELAVDDWQNPVGDGWPSVVIVCVPDPAIRAVAEALAIELAGPTIVLHTSGRLTSQQLECCRRTGAATGSFHPLQTFPGPPIPHDHWIGVPCAIEGDSPAVAIGQALATDLGAIAWRIEPELKHRYHAAAAVAGNVTHLLVAAARDLLLECGLPEPELIWPLVRASTRAALDHPGLEGLTGAIARGDQDAVFEHMAALPAPLDEIYGRLAAGYWNTNASTWLD